jgi:hypothetical protein
MMTSFLESLVIGLSISSLLLTGWWLSRRVFVWRQSQKALTPNCLLTRYPVLIITDQVSHWKFWSQEERAKHFLLNHGYSAVVVSKIEYSQMLRRDFSNRKFHALQNSHLTTPVRGLPTVDLQDHSSLLQHAIHFAEQEFI